MILQMTILTNCKKKIWFFVWLLNAVSESLSFPMVEDGLGFDQWSALFLPFTIFFKFSLCQSNIWMWLAEQFTSCTNLSSSSAWIFQSPYPSLNDFEMLFLRPNLRIIPFTATFVSSFSPHEFGRANYNLIWIRSI